jgi:hypothetical protein
MNYINADDKPENSLVELGIGDLNKWRACKCIFIPPIDHYSFADISDDQR